MLERSSLISSTTLFCSTLMKVNANSCPQRAFTQSYFPKKQPNFLTLFQKKSNSQKTLHRWSEQTQILARIWISVFGRSCLLQQGPYSRDRWVAWPISRGCQVSIPRSSRAGWGCSRWTRTQWRRAVWKWRHSSLCPSRLPNDCANKSKEKISRRSLGKRNTGSICFLAAAGLLGGIFKTIFSFEPKIKTKA